MKLEWNVYNESNQEMRLYNVFEHAHFVKSLADMFKEIKKEEARCIMKNTLNAKKLEEYIGYFSHMVLNSKCHYHFWGKCEYEVMLTTWPTSIDRKELYRLVDEDKDHIEKWGKPAYRYTPNLSAAFKIDIYDQLHLNWNQFKKYVFDNEKEIKKLNRENLKKYPHLKKN